jgi:hypothetical protein
MSLENNPFPFRVPTLVDSSRAVGNPFSTNAVLSSNKFEGVILQGQDKTDPTAGGQIYQLTKVDGVDKSQHMQEVIVRCEKLHAHIDRRDIERHKPAVIGFSDQSLNTGNRVEVAYSNPFTGEGGTVINVLEQGDSGDSGDKSGYNPDPRGVIVKGKTAASFQDDPANVGVKNTVVPEPPEETPFEVGFTGPNSLEFIRQATLKAFQKIATAAGWFYGSTEYAQIYVGQTGGIRKAKTNSLQHQYGYALDYTIVIDGGGLSKAESWAFVCACIVVGIVNKGGFGAYIDDKQNGAINPKKRKVSTKIKWQVASPHYDIRKISALWCQYYDKSEVGGKQGNWLAKTAEQVVIADNLLRIPTPLLKRARFINTNLVKTVKTAKEMWEVAQGKFPDFADQKLEYRRLVGAAEANRGKRL